MNIVWHRNFKKHYKKRVLPYSNINLKFKKKVKIFVENSKNLILKDHQLTGNKKEFRSFWITGGIRVTYKIKRDVIEFYDIGSHNQVY